MIALRPGLGQVPDELMDLLLGPDVHADGRLVDDQDVAVGGQPFRDADLLLVAAAQVLGPLVRAGRPDAQVPDHVPGDRRAPWPG